MGEARGGGRLPSIKRAVKDCRFSGKDLGKDLQPSWHRSRETGLLVQETGKIDLNAEKYSRQMYHCSVFG